MDGVQTEEWRFREYRESDIPTWVKIASLEYPEEPTSVEQEEHGERSYPRDNPRLRIAVVDADGMLVGRGVCEKPFWVIAPGVYTTYGSIVHPDWRRRGIGRALLAESERYAARHGAEKLWTECCESQLHSIRFLQAAGFRQFGVRFEQVVNLEQFDLAAFHGAIERVEAAGYRVTTLAALRKERPDTDQQLYQVFRETALDIPLPGGAQVSMDYEQWRKGLDGPTVDPAYTFLAVDGDKVVAETTLELLPNGRASTNSTGVLRGHRGRGIALAIKLASLQALKERGYKEARTHNDTQNPAILHLNEKIGYHRLPGWLQWEKLLK